MRLRALCFALAFVFLSCLIAFSGVCIKVSADSVVYTKMSADTWRSIYGDTFPCTYTINDVSYSGSFVYEHTFTSKSANGVNVASNSVCNNASDFAQYDIVCYSLTYSQSSVTLYNIDIDLDMIVTGGARGGFMLGQVPSTTTSNITTVINTISNVPDNYFGNFSAVTANDSADSSLANYWGVVSYSNLSSSVRYFRFIPYDDTDFSASGLHFEGFTNAQSNNKLLLYVLAPYYYGTVSETTSTTTSTTDNSGSTGDINVDVNIDLDETNGILGDILSVLSDFVGDILDGLKGLFVPDEEYLQNWLEDLVDLFEAKFFYSGIDIEPLKNALLDMATYGATTSIRFPGVDLTSCGIPFTIPPRAVELQPFGSPINTYIELSINIAATLAVFNLFFTKIKAILVGERVVEVEGDDE